MILSEFEAFLARVAAAAWTKPQSSGAERPPGSGLHVPPGIYELQVEYDQASLDAVCTMPGSYFVVHIPELAHILVITTAVRLLEQVKLTVIGLMVPDRAIASHHLHIAELALARVGIVSIRDPAVTISVGFPGRAGEKKNVRMFSAWGDA